MPSKKKFRLAFMGTPDFAVAALQSIHKAGYEIAAVYTQPARAAGRGQQVQRTPVHLAAEELGLEVRTPASLKTPEAQQAFAELKLDIAVVAAYGLILPQAILSAPQRGCVNIHASLLPRWRGAAPIQRAILANDGESGITIMQMDAGLDTGAMLMQEHVGLTPHTSASSLHDQLAAIGGRLIVAALDGLAEGRVTPKPQPEDGVTYAQKLSRDDGRIDWERPAAEIERQLRALTPWPGCFFTLNGETIKLLAANIVPDLAGAEGTLLDDQFTVACGDKSALRLVSLQRPGKSATDGAALLRGLRLPVGAKL